MAGEGRLICIGAVALGSLSLLVDLVRDGKIFYGFGLSNWGIKLDGD